MGDVDLGRAGLKKKKKETPHNDFLIRNNKCNDGFN